MDPFAIVLVVVALGFVIFFLIRSRRKQAKLMEEAPHTAAAAGLATTGDVFDSDTRHHAPVADFHVQGEEAIVTFDVPLADQEDAVLNELLVDEAIEVVREKRHTLPIDDVTVVVARAGRDEVREVGRSRLPAAGELPPPIGDMGLSFAQIAHDPFAAPFEEHSDHGVLYETKLDVPADELGPIIDELKLPEGLQRGLRAVGVDPDNVDAPDLILALLRMFGYSVTEQAEPSSYMAIKDGLSTYILGVPHVRGDHPELDESVITRFLGSFGSSGADRGLLITGKYGPFRVNEIETRQPNVRFITRERVQGFIERMALG
jgi:hypothetical protein